MIWRSLTFFSLCALTAFAAQVTGKIELLDSKDPSVRLRRDFSGVVVWLERIGYPEPITPQRTVRMIQKNKTFQPHVLAIPIGATVEFPNFDPIFHNAFSNFSGQPFDVGLYAPGTSQQVKFRREGVVRVFCNIHPAMSAVIVVLRTTRSAVTGRDGSFTIPAVDPGEYRLRVFHERSSEETLEKLERRLAIREDAVTLPPIRLSESGYLPVSHKNKYGKDYPPVVEDHITYPGAR